MKLARRCNKRRSDLCEISPKQAASTGYETPDRGETRKKGVVDWPNRGQVEALATCQSLRYSRAQGVTSYWSTARPGTHPARLHMLNSNPFKAFAGFVLFLRRVHRNEARFIAQYTSQSGLLQGSRRQPHYLGRHPCARLVRLVPSLL